MNLYAAHFSLPSSSVKFLFQRSFILPCAGADGPAGRVPNHHRVGEDLFHPGVRLKLFSFRNADGGKLSGELRLPHAPEPLMAPPEGASWRNLFSSNDVRYGGEGSPSVVQGDDERGDEGGIVLPGDSAVLLGAL